MEWFAAAEGVKNRRADLKDGADAILKKQRESSKALKGHNTDSLDRERNLARVKREREHLHTLAPRTRERTRRFRSGCQMDQQKMKILEKHRT